MNPTNGAFDNRGNMLWSDDGRGRTVYAYDHASRLAGAVYPDGSGVDLGYDRAGNLASRRTSGGADERFGYDPSGRLTTVAFTDGTTIDFDYDESGHIKAAKSPGCSTSYVYETRDWPIRSDQTIGRVGFSTGYAYDEQGVLAGVRVPGFDRWLRYRYDEQRRLVACGYDGAPDLVRLAYADGGRTVDMHFGNGVTQHIIVDRRGLAQRITAESLDGTALLDLRYRSDPTGNITAINEQRHRYDGRGRLVEHGPLMGERAGYTYDMAGNRTAAHTPGGKTTTYRYDTAGRLAGWRRPDGAETRCGYDTAGNLTDRIDARGAWSYRYDGAGRLVRALRDGQVVAEYGYDHSGRQVFKRAGGVTMYTHRDPWGHRLAETTDSGTTRVLLGPPGRPLAVLDIAGERIVVHFLHTDHLGSVHAVTDEMGRVVARYAFDPFGCVIDQATEDTEDTEGREQIQERTISLCSVWQEYSQPVFAGHTYDADLGLYACGVRWYDPQIGRFVSADSYSFAADDPRLLWLPAPAEERQKLRQIRLRTWQQHPAHRNRYVYAINNPLTYIDQDGHQAGLYVLYTILGLVWALPYTLVGFLLFEFILNWITFAFLWSGDYDLSGQSSDRLGAWAIWSVGGLSGKIVVGGGAFTLGNYVIANGPFFNGLNTTNRTFAIPARTGEFDPFNPATATLLTQREAIVEHELRHTNQYGWWGPFMMPWVLIFYVLVLTVYLAVRSAANHESFAQHWRNIWNTLTNQWWKVAIDIAVIVLLPGAYWYDYMFRGGYGNSWFEQDAAQNSGASNSINVRATASTDSVGTGGTAVVSVISDPNLVGSLTLNITTNNSGGTLTPLALGPVANLRAWRYTAGPTAGRDTLTASDGSATHTVEISVS
jgi:RHS repeat-associated protein